MADGLPRSPIIEAGVAPRTPWLAGWENWGGAASRREAGGPLPGVGGTGVPRTGAVSRRGAACGAALELVVGLPFGVPFGLALA